MAADGTRSSSKSGTRASLCVLVCRGCCCGTERKHPDVDHAAQTEELRAAAAESGGRVIHTRCLDVCERSNVVVIKTANETYWFGDLLSPERITRVASFIRSGGVAPAPRDLSFNVVARRASSAAYPCDCRPVKLPA